MLKLLGHFQLYSIFFGFGFWEISLFRGETKYHSLVLGIIFQNYARPEELHADPMSLTPLFLIGIPIIEFRYMPSLLY